MSDHLAHLADQVPFESALEGAQHGDKPLAKLAAFCHASGFAAMQPSNYHFVKPDGAVMTKTEVGDALGDTPVRIIGISGHCPVWVAGTAWTGSPTIRPFIPEKLHRAGVDEIEQWGVDSTLRTLDLCAALGIKVMPMFWGTLYGWEVATGYPWGFFAGPGYDLIKEGDDRFVAKTKRIRDHARGLGISLAHEIHPGTAAMTADDFLRLVQLCDGDSCLGVNADPSHCWEGESWETRFLKVGKYITGVHVKDHLIRPGFPLRGMCANWKDRGMQFCRLGHGQIDLVRYAQIMHQVGYAERYCKAHGVKKAPLVGEAEDAYVHLDVASSSSAGYINEKLCVPYAGRSFEDGMGAGA